MIELLYAVATLAVAFVAGISAGMALVWRMVRPDMEAAAAELRKYRAERGARFIPSAESIVEFSIKIPSTAAAASASTLEVAGDDDTGEGGGDGGG